MTILSGLHRAFNEFWEAVVEMLNGLGTLFGSGKRERQGTAKLITDEHNFERDMSMDATIKMDQKKINDAIERNSSKNDKFFDDVGQSTDLSDAFEGFADVVMVDDKTEIDFDHLDNDLAPGEDYD